MTNNKILDNLPYKKPFLFVDQILHVDDFCIKGKFTFTTDMTFYSGHFINKPTTPGVLIVEAFAQLGGVAHGIYLLNLYDKEFTPAFSSASFEFFKFVQPGESIHIYSEKIALRNNYLKIKGEVHNSNGELVLQLTGTCKFITYE